MSLRSEEVMDGGGEISEERLKVPGKMRPMTEARAVAAAIVQVSSHLRLTDRANLLGRDVSALGKAAQRVAEDERYWAIVGEMVDTMKSAGSGP